MGIGIIGKPGLKGVRGPAGRPDPGSGLRPLARNCTTQVRRGLQGEPGGQVSVVGVATAADLGTARRPRPLSAMSSHQEHLPCLLTHTPYGSCYLFCLLSSSSIFVLTETRRSRT